MTGAFPPPACGRIAKPTPLTDAAIRQALLDLAAERRHATFCPSEAARRLAGDWRPLMPRVRAVAADLIGENRLRCLQNGRTVDIQAARGPIRLSHR